ncbi:MAG: type II toxin-antitoxin system RelE family toxin [Bacteroidia bacterium]
MYKVTVSRSAEKELSKIPKGIVNRIGTAIESLMENPRPTGSKKLKGTDENLWRIRIGDYRVVYDIEDSIRIIDIKKVGHGKDIYQ